MTDLLAFYQAPYLKPRPLNHRGQHQGAGRRRKCQPHGPANWHGGWPGPSAAHKAPGEHCYTHHV